MLTFVVGVYLYKTESGPQRSTRGKRRMGLDVSATDGSVPKRSKILLRTIVKLLPWETAHFFIRQLMGVIHREGSEATPRASIFVGLNIPAAAAIVYIAMVVATGRGPHDPAAGTEIRVRAVPAS